MTKYLLAYHGGQGMGETEAEQRSLMVDWGRWFGGLGDALVDGGNPISTAKTVGADGSVSEGGGSLSSLAYALGIHADSLMRRRNQDAMPSSKPAAAPRRPG